MLTAENLAEDTSLRGYTNESLPFSTNKPSLSVPLLQDVKAFTVGSPHSVSMAHLDGGRRAQSKNPLRAASSFINRCFFSYRRPSVAPSLNENIPASEVPLVLHSSTNIESVSMLSISYSPVEEMPMIPLGDAESATSVEIPSVCTPSRDELELSYPSRDSFPNTTAFLQGRSPSSGENPSVDPPSPMAVPLLNSSVSPHNSRMHSVDNSSSLDSNGQGNNNSEPSPEEIARRRRRILFLSIFATLPPLYGVIFFTLALSHSLNTFFTIYIFYVISTATYVYSFAVILLWLLAAVTFLPVILFLLIAFFISAYMVYLMRTIGVEGRFDNGNRPMPTELVEKLQTCSFKEVLHSLEEHSRRTQSNSEQGETPADFSIPRTCSICMTEIEDEDKVMVMPCDLRHFFHYNCVIRWLERSEACPICRANLSTALNREAPNNSNENPQQSSVEERV
ncbi:putative E3 ubiquitin-protein ligase RNF181 [Cardiosporidium cionae]|uniref:E3 ubiquitin-protein ligase RNF181 n=1 Tax=Cardiosporidium cionae TaxID=476202 RepID=A0ABQ7JCC3_9APIC|nr:putative E3 ubiquitin-protein ligase RNF181 [Cardiosporidium cionae]|eukprot:KAF8821621.1 putative E3 ubiquitin-protein ligase RNF181 [Cardiosporidium cionae]